MNIYGVLLIPKHGDLHGLLKDGLCGSKPPSAWCNETENLLQWIEGPPHPALGSSPKHALVLAWNYKLIPEGVLRLALIGQWHPVGTCELWVKEVMNGIQDGAAVDDLGTLVLINKSKQNIPFQILEPNTCIHCGNGPANYSDGFNGVKTVISCPGFHCFDCAQRHHSLTYPGPKQ